MASACTVPQGSRSGTSRSAAFARVVDGAGQVAEDHPGERGQHQVGGDLPVGAERPGGGDAGLGLGEGLLRPALLDPEEGQVPVDLGGEAGVVEVGHQGDGGVDVGLGPGHVARRRLQPAGQEVAGGAVARGHPVPRRGHRLPEASGPGDAVAEHDPRPPETEGDAQPRSPGRGGRSRPGRRRCRPARHAPAATQARLARAPPLGPAPVRDRPEPVGVGRPGLRRPARDLQALDGVGPDAVEQAVPQLRRPPPSSTATSERSTSRPSTSTATDLGTPSAPRTCSAAASGRRPGEHRRAPRGHAGRRGRAGRSSTPMAAARARRRSGRRLVGSCSRANRSSSRREISWTDSDRTRAAASSMASGRPSSDRHTSSTSSAVSASAANRGRRRQRRERANSATESSTRDSGSSACRTSPSRPRGTWLVASTRRVGAASSSCSTRSATGPTTCSQLSSTSSVGAPPSRSDRARLTPGDVERLGHELRHRRARVRAVETDQPHAARPVGRPGDLDGEPGLADPRRAHDGDDAAVRDDSPATVARSASRPPGPSQRGEVADRRRAAPAGPDPEPTPTALLAAPAPRARAGRGPARGRAPRPAAGPHPCVGGQGVGLATRPVERGDERRPQTLRAAGARRPAPRARRWWRRRRRDRPAAA